MVAMFDFGENYLNYHKFYRQLFDLVINQDQADFEILESAKHFAFQVYDMNCDESLDQTDMFSFIKDVKNDGLFNSACYKDIQDIQTYLDLKQTKIHLADPVLDQTDLKKPKIKDIEVFLDKCGEFNKQREGFLTVFSGIKDGKK